MEDLSPRERALARRDSVRSATEDDRDGGTDELADDEAEGSLSPRERALARRDSLRGGAPGPAAEDVESVFYPDEGTEAPAGGDGTTGTGEVAGGFDAEAVDVGAERERMNALARIQQERNQKPEEVQSDLEAGTTAAAEDPGIDPGDESEQKKEREESLLREAIETGIRVASAATPGTPENKKMVGAIYNGVRQTVEQMRFAKAATDLVQSPETIQGPSIPFLLEGPSIDASRFEDVEPTEAEREETRRIREQAAADYADSIDRLSQIPRPESVKEAQEADGFFETIQAVADDPHVAIPNLVASSSLQSLPAVGGALLGAPAGPVGSAMGQYAGTSGVEQSAAMANLLAESGVDVRDPKALLAATADPKKRREIKNRARRRGMAVGAVDGLFGMLSMGLTRVGLSKVAEGAGGFVLESAGEGVSELAGQAAAGEEISTSEATIETIAGLGQSGATSLGQVALSELLPSEGRVQTELQRQVDEGEASLENPEQEMLTLMERAVNNGAVEQPQTAAERALDEAINKGEVQVQRPDPKDLSDEALAEEQERLAEQHRQATRAGEEFTRIDRLVELEQEQQLRREQAETEAGETRLTDRWQPLPDEADVPAGAETFETSTGTVYARREDAAGRREATAAGGQGGPTESRREPSTPEQRLQALGVSVEGLTPNREDVADLEGLAREAETMDASELQSRIEEFEARIEDARKPIEEREGPMGQDLAKLEAGRAILQQARLEEEAEETGPADPGAEDETEAAPEAGEEPSQFERDVTEAEPDLLQAAAQNDELDAGEAAEIRAEVERRREADDMGDQQAEAILQALPPEEGEAQGAEEGQAETEDTDETEPDEDVTEADGLQSVENTELARRAREIPEDGPEAQALAAEVERRQSEGEINPAMAEGVMEDLPAGTTMQSADDMAGPPRADLEEGATFVDVGGTEPVEVEITGEPDDRTVPVRGISEGEETKVKTRSLIQNLRRPEEVEGEIAGSSFPVADVQDSGRAVLSDEWQIIPEHATIPEAAEVRHDLGTSDLPAARLPGAEEEGESLSQMGRRSETQAEQDINQQVEQVERELQQAKQELKDLKQQRPEQQQQAEAEQGGLFGSTSSETQAGGQQQALGDEFTAADETTEELQQMIDEQKQYVERLQDRLVDLRRQAPDARSEARRSQVDLEDQMEAEQEQETSGTAPAADDAGPDASPPRSMADMQTVPEEEFADPEARTLRRDVITEDLFSVVRDKWRQEGVTDRLNTVARTVDRIRELRAADERGMIGSEGVERDVANMRDMIDEQLADLENTLAPAEMDALRQRVRAWTGRTGVPDPPSTLHLNNLETGDQRFPDYQTGGGYEVRLGEAGQIEVISPNTGSPIDGRSSNYEDVLVEYFRENSERIDRIPRVTDADPEIGFGQWADAVASSSRNPFEIMEAILVKQDDSFNPVEIILEERGRISLESLSPYVASDEVFEQGLQNWVEKGGADINQIAKQARERYGINVTPQELLDDFIRPNPGGPSTILRNDAIDPLLARFRDVTGLDVDLGFIERLHSELYETTSEQNQDDAGTGASFEPAAPYLARPTQTRSNGYTWTGVRYRRDPNAESLRDRAEDGYELRDGAGEEARDSGLRAMEQLSLFGPPEGETEAESAMHADPGEADDEAGVDAGEIGTTDEESDLLRPTEEEMQRIRDGLLGRGITDDLAENHSASLVGRTVAGPDDLAAISQIYRDPRFETFRFFFVRDNDDGTQEIVHQQGVSSRLPGVTTHFAMEVDGTAYLPEDVNADEVGKWEQLSYWMSHQMDKAGADGYYVMHNHPSGNTQPSKGDRNVTKGLVVEQEGFRGHVIIDSGEYSVLQAEAGRKSPGEARALYRDRSEDEYINADRERLRKQAKRDFEITRRREEIDDPEVLRRAQIEQTESEVNVTTLPEGVEVEGAEEGSFTTQRQVDRLRQASIDHPALDQTVASDDDVALVAADITADDLSDPGNPVIITTAADGTVRGVMEVDADFLMRGSVRQVSRQVMNVGRYTGATRAFITNVDEDLLGEVQRFTTQGIFMDYLTKSGKSRADYGQKMSRGAARNQFGFEVSDVSPARALEPENSYGGRVRDEVRRRVGRLQHEATDQLSPHAESGPTDAESIRQAAVRIGGTLYRGRTHPDALQAAVNDGALDAGAEGAPPAMPDGRSLEQAEEDGDVDLGLYTTSEGRVVQHQGTADVIGVDRADEIRSPRPTPQRPLEPPPSAEAVSRQLARITDHGAKVEVSENLPPGANSVDVTLETVSPEEERRQGIEKALNDQALDSENPVSAPEVIRTFIDVVRAAGREVPIKYGRYRGFSFDTAGVFKVQPEVIRLKEAGDVPTAAHEMGHALEKAVFDWVDGSAWQQAVAGTDGLVQEELVRLGEDLYGDREPNGGYKREGWAEFVKFYLVNQERIKDRAPATLEWFESEFLPDHPDIADAMETARNRAQTWYQQGSISRAKAQVEKRRSWWENFRRTVTTSAGRERLKTEASKTTLTEFSPLLRLVEEAEERMGESLDIDENPFLTAEALQKTHAARTRMMVEQGTFDFAGNPKGPPLRDAAQIVQGQRDEFTIYLWARRALKLWEGREAQYDEDGTLVQTEKEPRNPGLAKDDAQYIFDYYDSPEFRQAADMVYQWNKDVLDYTKVAFDPQMAEQIKKGDVGDYVPLQRVFGDLDEQVIEARDAAGGSAVLGSDPIDALEGSSRRIRDPFQTMIEQAEQLIRATHERYVLNQLVKIGKNVPGMGRFIEKVPRDQLPTRINTERIVSDLRDQGLNIELPRGELNAKIEQVAEQFEDGRRPDMEESEIEEVAREELMEEKMTEFMTFFKPAVVPEGQSDPIVSIQNPETGDVEWFELSADLYETFGGLDIYRLPRYLDQTLGTAARLKRLGTTGLRASFALITNPARDLATLYAQSRSSQNPASMFAGYLQSMKAGIESVVRDEVDVDPSFARFMRLGGSISRPLGVDTQQTKRAVRELFQGRTVRILNPSNWADHLRDVFQVPESATRVAEFKARAEEIGWEEGTQMSDAQALQLLLDSKRVTTDFSSQGKYTKVYNQMVPFVTATIGGQRAFFRAFKQNPKRAIAAATTLLASTLGYWWSVKDEPWYKDMPAREKLNNWFFPIDDGNVLVLPRPFEWGVTFSGIPEALIDAWYQQDPDGVDDALGHLYRNWSPLGTTDFGKVTVPFSAPVPLQVGAEQLANRRFYFDSPIVPRGEERKPAAEQFGSYTSTVAIQVGRAFDVSPRRVDHLIAGFLGGVGRDATESMDALLSVLGLEGASPSVQREQTAADVPVVGELFRPGGKPGVQSEAVNDFYKTLEDYQTRQASDVQKETWEQRQTRLMLGDAQKALSLLFWLRQNTKDAARRRNIQREIRAIAQDAMRTADEGIEAVLEQRGELGAMNNLYRNRENFDVEQLRPIIENVNPEALEMLDERRAAEDSTAEENPTSQ